MSDNKKLLALLQRPSEPTFFPKDGGKTLVDLPEEYLTERYRPIGASLQTRFSSEADTRIPVRALPTPDLAFAEALPRRGNFSLFIPKHRQIAGELIALFLNQPNVDALMSAGSYARDRLNPILFQYAMSVAIQHREDTKNLNIPTFLELFPDSFIDPSTFPKLREEGSAVLQKDRITVDIQMNYTASDREEEQRMAYFREDIGVNLHHWHWHLVYPGEGPDRVVNKDRRGELFYYMHQQLIARYNVDRFCNRLARVRPLTSLREPIPEGYFPKLIRSFTNRAFPARPQNHVLRDLNRIEDDVVLSISDLERWGSRIAESIDGGYVVGPGGARTPLDERTGIDVLGNIMEPSALSVNSQYYGNYHGHMHNLIAFSHDPENRFLEGYGVVGEFQTAMRDPTFYRLHAQVDNMFHRYKRTLQPYNANQLGYTGVQIQSLGVQLNRANAPANVLLTYWQRSKVDLSTGLDFGPEGNVFASFTHLQHAPFTYRLTVNNTSGAARRGTCRIFIAPKVDERNTPLTLDEQRLLMVELDKFQVNLTPGSNNLVRRSEQSSVTIPYERTFRPVAQSNLNIPETEMFRFCNCGWPHHLLVPKGSAEGMKFDLFAMISNFADDRVEQVDQNVNCNDSHSFCGLRGLPYPDRRHMGFPFDRRIPTAVRSLTDFTRANTNMRTTEVTVRFTNTVIHPREPLFLPKNNGTLFYDVPESFLTARYRPIGQNLANRFGPNSSLADQVSHDTGVEPTVVPIRELKQVPDLKFAQWIDRRGGFSLLNGEHRKTAAKLMKLFLNQPDADTLFDVAAYARDRLNGPLYQYALAVVLLHRPDTKHIAMPSILHLFPDQFIDPSALSAMAEEGSIVMDENRMAIEIPMNFTASNDDPEQRMAYFREDIGLNMHHWHWHLVYPSAGPAEIVRKDRRGELFYYMHNQMLNRYQTDRYAQGLGRLESLTSFRNPIRVPYYSKLLRSSNNRTFPPRYPNMTVSDVVRPNDRLNVTITNMESWISQVMAAIDAGTVVGSDGVSVLLDNPTGIEILVNLVERSALSINRNLYGDIHNSGHTLLAYIHDPRGTYLESYGVVGGLETAVRDPVFYMWHKFVDDLFQRHKARLTPYRAAELSNSFITLQTLETQLDSTGGAINTLVTFLERSQVDLGAGLDFGPGGNAIVTFTHLQHAPFTFRLVLTNSAIAGRRDTVRLFLLPRVDHQGRSLTFEERRLLAIELDSFQVTLRPGTNTIVRRSDASNVTIPYDRMFQNVAPTTAGNVQARFCGCGWPAHMLLPKGNENGVQYDLFAMVSRFEDDNANVTYDETVGCDDSYSFCGLRDRVYPSRRPMGFPFDRKVSSTVQSMGDFVAPYRNMRLTTVTLSPDGYKNWMHWSPSSSVGHGPSNKQASLLPSASEQSSPFYAQYTTMADNRKLLALLQRPLEPTFYPKDDGKTVVDLPENFLTDRYRPIGASLQSRFGNDAETRIPVRSVAPPSISFAEAVPRRGGFSLFNPKHRQIAGDLINLYLSQPDVDTLMSVAAYSRDRLNPILFQYALSVAIQHRPDTNDLNVPSFLELFPDSFVDPTVFPKLREEGSIVQAENRMVIDIPLNYTASDREDEQRLAYFREDIGVNLHHWHWHLVYPGEGPDRVVNKDRRGELFYYMHQQLIARYNVERFCNRLARVRPLTNLREPLAEGYFPKIIRSLNNRAFPPRPQNTVLRDINRVDDGVNFTISDLERVEARIAESIDGGYVVAPGGNRVPLDERTGIDVLGNIMEPSALSVNSTFYGNYHGNLHNIIAYSHDPDNRFLEGYGVVGEFQTAMRDPTFYRLHAQVDNMFHRYKRTLQPYNENQLGYNGIQIQSVGVQLNRANAPANVLLTYWQRTQVDLATGLDFGPQGNVFASFTHLQHAPFTFRLAVNNTSGAARRGTCRIFIGPKVDERNTTLTMEEQRLLMVELDKFNVNLNPGVNNIVRRSEQSSVTIPYERTFRNVSASNNNVPETEMFRFCNCGWPHHLLIPKGAPEGMQFDLFAMISNYADDTVNQEFDENVNCNDSHSFCGLRDQLYPDRRPMGYPFDRRMPTAVRTLGDFLRPNSNMAMTQVQVRFTNTVIART
ncbi:uncharacterized protein LOC131294559 [Anopheles ziemanni]|uniref:uncharacterized protein LOC131265186 n=1 Tax=Anopheles coustani TaxID=139045 RepID=UPI002658D650|nr:uncharacterized protein LOC131265186 [Anopheles coustani]XP_058178587.1 uncharacterized protein LOC131294559 [Anopheles ziemanni]